MYDQLPLIDINAHDPVPMPAEWSDLRPNLEAVEDIEKASRVEREEYCGQVLKELVRCYEALREQGRVVAAAIWKDGQRELPAKMIDAPEAAGIEARQRAIEAVTTWTFQEGQDSHETTVYRGALSSSDDTLKAIQELNELKAAFSQVHGALKKTIQNQSSLRSDMAGLINMVSPAENKIVRAQEVGSILRDLLHPRLSVRQLIRAIPIVDSVPMSVRWRWVESASSVRVSREKLLAMLEKKADQPFAVQDMNRIMAIPGETHFALRRSPGRDLRMQVRFPKTGGKTEPFVIFKRRVPLFYREARKDAWRQEPDLSAAPENALRSKRKRKVEEQPFLQTMPAHRYCDP